MRKADESGAAATLSPMLLLLLSSTAVFCPLVQPSLVYSRLPSAPLARRSCSLPAHSAALNCTLIGPQPHPVKTPLLVWPPVETGRGGHVAASEQARGGQRRRWQPGTAAALSRASTISSSSPSLVLVRQPCKLAMER